MEECFEFFNSRSEPNETYEFMEFEYDVDNSEELYKKIEEINDRGKTREEKLIGIIAKLERELLLAQGRTLEIEIKQDGFLSSPIKTADWLIDRCMEETRKMSAKTEHMRRLQIDSLRQIAEHLLVFCGRKEDV